MLCYKENIYKGLVDNCILKGDRLANYFFCVSHEQLVRVMLHLWYLKA